jgi:hypothetical protein
MLCIWHRRAGKDKTLINLCAREAFRRVGAYYYYFPTAVWARRVVWDGMDKAGLPFRKHFPEELVARVKDREMQIEFVNGSVFQIIGTDSLDVVGVNPVGCVFSEYSLQNPKAWQYVTPILAENEGWAAFNYTPRGKNHGHKLYMAAKDSEDWYCELLTVKDTKAISRKVIESDIRDGAISKELAEQEYFCSFDFGMEGTVFGGYLRELSGGGRIKKGLYDGTAPVYTFWDLGVADAMSVWFGQAREDGNGLAMVDHVEESNRGLDWFKGKLDELRDERGYRYAGHFAPHDIQKRSVVDATSIIATAAKMGIAFQVIPRTSSVEADIELVRRLLPRFMFDEERCSHGLTALGDYHRDAETGKPVHDWTSHAVDAFRTACRAVEMGLVRSSVRYEGWRRGDVRMPERTANAGFNALEWGDAQERR